MGPVLLSDYRFHRTTAQALKGADYASAVVRYRSSRAPLFIGAAVVVASASIVAWLLLR